MFLAPGSLLLELMLAEACALPTGRLDGVAIFEVGGSTLARLLLLEKKDVDCVGSLEVLEVVDVMDDLRDGPTGILSFCSGGFSACLADRKPNAPREAMVAAWLATALNETQRREL